MNGNIKREMETESRIENAIHDEYNIYRIYYKNSKYEHFLFEDIDVKVII